MEKKREQKRGEKIAREAKERDNETDEKVGVKEDKNGGEK